MSTRVLAEEADLNLALTWTAVGRLAGQPAQQTGSLYLYSTGLPVAAFNGAVAIGATDDPTGAIESVMTFMEGRDVPWTVWVRRGTDDALVEAGRALGLAIEDGPPSMGLTPIPTMRPSLPGVRVEVVDGADGLATHRDLASRAFEMPPAFVERLVTEATIADPAFGVVVGIVDGTPVSTALLSITGTTAGIYNVATPTEFQRRGYGAALTWAAIDEGVRRGCDRATLQASAAGRPVYERMGFAHLGTYKLLRDVSFS